ncbi:hypothetical protein HO173_002799 [Letharia columbiana]|uniref:Phospholipid metabolism enzyme regulator n=1 Tax=Letharia columbiana TaxID=112416 RepID=A0A8H6G1R7_9LECA|nr:uncharacterized protein HO173_002799 [Letharia columbiana]KAF6238927.1 hypothetical protein HO173_002799 [Letharia columbiana]
MAPTAEKPNNDQAEVEEKGNDENKSDPSKEGTQDSQQPSSSAPSLIRASTTPQLSANSSATTSPKPSREGSPVRPPLKPGASTGSRLTTRSRKNSQDLSPIRGPSANIPTVPSAAAIQRALSATGTPHLPPSTAADFAVDTPRPQRANKGPAGGSQHSGSSVLRVKSPPPSASSGTNSSYLTSRKIDQSQSTPTTPTIVVERPTRSSTFGSESDIPEDDHPVKSGMRTPVRIISGNGPALETVQESSLPATPAIGTRMTHTSKGGSNDHPERIEENPMEEAFGKEADSRPESGNDSAGSKRAGAKGADGNKDTRKPATAANSAKPPVVQLKKSFTQLPFTKSKIPASDGSVKNMTVETETVSSIPQLALGGGAGERHPLGRTETGGSLRLKPSNETIRPKKEKKRVVRKAPSMNSGTASSKADIFEAKVASAVDEADSSDSEETFVYESNPPEPHSARANRFHSRTPSATSTASHHDHYGAKGRHEGHHSVVGKKSMKFSNNYNSIGYSNEGGDGTVRGPSQTGRPASGNTTHHHHIGRYGRGGHASLFDSDSPFPNATKSTRSATGHVSPRSSRNPQAVHVTKSPRKIEELMSYDFEGEGADDERTPLIGSVRSGRNRRRPLPGSVRHIYSENRDHRCCGRVTAFTGLGSVLAVLIAAIVMILVMCSKPLIDVHVKDIRNVLASEQEIMLDLHVHAMNPNILAIQVSELDVNIFAKSKHVGTSSLWRSGHPQTSTRKLRSKSQKNEAASQQAPPLLDPSDIISHFDGGVDEGTDPIDDPTTDSQTMLLGQIFEFDSPLIFEASPIRHYSLGSVGEVRLAKPGNRTEEGGSERWEHVLQYDFDLIVRGVMKYSLPISSRLRKVNIAGSVIVHPSDGISGSGTTNVQQRTGPFEQGSNVLVERSLQDNGLRVRFDA